MLNWIWFLLLTSGVLVAAWQGNVDVVTDAALSSARDAVEVCFNLVGIMALWLGIMRIAEAGGLVRVLARILRPMMVRIFPSVPPHHPAMGAIILNLSANMLGLGNAATPFGMRAMQGLKDLNPHPGEASEAMCTFLALNTSCITLLPATMIGVRMSFHSAEPTEIVGPCIMATAVSMAVAIALDWWFRTRSPWRRR